nr:hypothetical protein [Streptococcus oralis]
MAFLLIDYKGRGMANLFKNLPHLFLISDEFAELKVNQPDFWKSGKFYRKCIF